MQQLCLNWFNWDIYISSPPLTELENKRENQTTFILVFKRNSLWQNQCNSILTIMDFWKSFGKSRSFYVFFPSLPRFKQLLIKNLLVHRLRAAPPGCSFSTVGINSVFSPFSLDGSTTAYWLVLVNQTFTFALVSELADYGWRSSSR